MHPPPGRTLRDTTGEGFYADLQRIQVSDAVEVVCFQMPGGGNIFLLCAPDETVMIDTGYGVYHQDVVRMLQHYGLGDLKKIRRVYITHADADHCGAGGLFEAEAYMHSGSLAIIRQANRAYGSRSEASILEEVYTTIINLFSRFAPPEDPELFPAGKIGMRSIFPVSPTLQSTTLSSRSSSPWAGTCTARSISSAPTTASSSPPIR